MRMQSYKDLVFFSVFVLVYLFLIWLKIEPLLLVFGLALVLYLPGYFLISFLFKEKQFEFLEKNILSVGLSVCISPLISMFLDKTTFGVTSKSVRTSLISFCVLFSMLAFLKRKKNAK